MCEKSIKSKVDGISLNKSENRTDDDIGTNQIVTSFSFDTYDLLLSICEDNKKYYESDASETGQRILFAFQKIIDHLPTVRDYHKQFNTFLHEYDFDENTPGNGYRSIIKAAEVGINRYIKVGLDISRKRDGLLFKKTTYMKLVRFLFISEFKLIITRKTAAQTFTSLVNVFIHMAYRINSIKNIYTVYLKSMNSNIYEICVKLMFCWRLKKKNTPTKYEL